MAAVSRPSWSRWCAGGATGRAGRGRGRATAEGGARVKKKARPRRRRRRRKIGRSEWCVPFSSWGCARARALRGTEDRAQGAVGERGGGAVKIGGRASAASGGSGSCGGCDAQGSSRLATRAHAHRRHQASSPPQRTLFFLSFFFSRLSPRALHARRGGARAAVTTSTDDPPLSVALTVRTHRPPSPVCTEAAPSTHPCTPSTGEGGGWGAFMPFFGPPPPHPRAWPAVLPSRDSCHPQAKGWHPCCDTPPRPNVGAGRPPRAQRRRLGCACPVPRAPDTPPPTHPRGTPMGAWREPRR